MKINLKFNMKNYLKFSSILVVGALPAQSQYGGKGSPPSLGWVSRILEGRSGAGDVLDTLQSDCVEFRALLLDLQRFLQISCDFQRFSTILANFQRF